MICLQQSLVLLPLIEEAILGGAGLDLECMQIGLSARTVQSWRRPSTGDGDRRVKFLRMSFIPKNKLTQSE